MTGIPARLFKDVDSIELGDDFVEVITSAVESCDVLLALIGKQWSTITDPQGRRRLDDPDDFVRLEIEAALRRNVRVIPVLVGSATMPHANELPPTLTGLVRRQALELSSARFDFDTGRLLKVLDTTLAEVHTAPEHQPAQTAVERPPLSQRVPASTPLPGTVSAGQVATGEIPRPSSRLRLWLGRSALLTAGLVLALVISISIADHAPGVMVLGLIALPFLVGWLLLRSRPRIGAAVTGVSAAAWTLLALWFSSVSETDTPTTVFLVLTISSALAAVVLSILVIRSP